MRIASTVVVITLCAGLLTACSKQESSTPEPPKETPQAAEAPEAAAEVEKAVEEAKPAAQEAATSADGTAQNMINMAQSLIGDSKYSEAMDLLKRLSAMELTPEQKKLVDDLMAQAQKAMTGAAAPDATEKAKDAAGGMLGGTE